MDDNISIHLPEIVSGRTQRIFVIRQISGNNIFLPHRMYRHKFKVILQKKKIFYRQIFNFYLPDIQIPCYEQFHTIIPD